MWGIRVIIPPKLLPQVFKELHQGHIGVMKDESHCTQLYLVAEYRQGN